MGTIRKQSVQASLVLAVGVGLGFILKLFIFTAYLNPEEIGLLTVLLDSANLFAAFIPLGSQQIFIKYFPLFKKGQKDPKGLLWVGFIFALTGFILFSTVFYLLKDEMVTFYSDQAPLLAKYIGLTIPLVLARVVFIVLLSYAQTIKKIIFPLIVKEIINRVLTGALVVLYAQQLFNLDALAILFVAIYYIAGSLVLYFLFYQEKADFSRTPGLLKKKYGKEIATFGFFALLNSAGGILIKNIDSLMITSLASLNAAGIYAIAFFIGQIIELPRRVLSRITAPFISSAIDNEAMQNVKTIYQKSALHSLIVGSLLLICIWTNIDNLFSIIPNGSVYSQGKYVVLFIGLGKLFNMSMGVNTTIIHNSPFYRFNFYSTLLMGGLGIATNIMLIPRMGIIGAALASLATFIIINVLKTSIIKIKLKFSPFSIKTLYAVFIIFLAYAIGALLPQLANPYFDIMYRSSITIIIFAYIIYKFNISTDINEMLNNFLVKFR